MRVDALHRRVAADVRALHEPLSVLFPPRLPKVYETRDMNIRGFIRRLNTACEPRKVFNEIKDDKAAAISDIIIEGLWVSPPDLPQNGSAADVRLIWNLHPKLKRFTMTPYHWRRRRFYFYQLLMHELIHRHQNALHPNDGRVYRPRGVDDRDAQEKQKYLGTVDEIETHAHDTMVELVTWFPQLPYRKALSALLDVKGPTPSTYAMYTKTFSKDHPAFVHYKRKLDSWYDIVRKNLDFYESLELASLV